MAWRGAQKPEGQSWPNTALYFLGAELSLLRQEVQSLGPDQAKHVDKTDLAEISASWLGYSWNILFIVYLDIGSLAVNLGPDPSQTLDYSLYLRSVQF